MVSSIHTTGVSRPADIDLESFDHDASFYRNIRALEYKPDFTVAKN